MEFIEFLDREEIEIIRIVEQVGYTTIENTPLCLLSNKYVGFLQKKQKTIIICTGAAISFLTKVQAPINVFYDKLYLGWLIRFIHKPKSFFPRIIQSFNLIKLF